MGAFPGITIVIPTHNRKALVQQSLEALAAQAGGGVPFEVVVAADACDDGTEAAVADAASRMPFELRVRAHRACNAGATRNLGAAEARGETLVFMDDDMDPRPGFVAAHWSARGPERVVMGYSKPVFAAHPSLWQQEARLWWEDAFREMASPGHRFTYRDFFSGNASMPAALFRSVGGMDATLGRLEDYEFGLRLLKAGARFGFEPDAAALHHDSTGLGSWLLRIRHEGEADVRTGTRHPEVRYRLNPFGYPERLTAVTRVARRLAFASPGRGDIAVAKMAEAANWLGRRGALGTSRRIVAWLREYNYARGVAAGIGGRASLLAWLQDGPSEPSVGGNAPVMDLDAPPSGEALTACLEAGSREGLRVRLAGVEIGVILPQPGAEGLRIEHVERWMRELLARQFVPELALDAALSGEGHPALPGVRRAAAC